MLFYSAIIQYYFDDSYHIYKNVEIAIDMITARWICIAYIQIVIVYIILMSIHIYNGFDRNSMTRMANLFCRIITRAFCFPLYLNLISSLLPLARI